MTDSPEVADDPAVLASDNEVAYEDKPSNALLENRRERRLAEKRYVTGRIGETCRFIGFGVVAIFYTILTSDQEFAKSIVQSDRNILFMTGIFGSLIIFFDYMQYLSGHYAAALALKNKESYLYGSSWISYRAKLIFYWLKQIATFVASTLVIYMILSQFIWGPSVAL